MKGLGSDSARAILKEFNEKQQQKRIYLFNDFNEACETAVRLANTL